MLIEGKMRFPEWDKNDVPGSRLVVDLGSFHFVSAPSGPVDAHNEPSRDELPTEGQKPGAAPPASI